MKHLFNVTVIGGDPRHIHIINKLAENDVTVYPIGFDQEGFNHDKIIKTEIEDCPFEKIDAIILPVGGTNEDGTVENIDEKDMLYVRKEMLEKTPEHCTIFTGAANVFLQNIVERANRKIIRMFADDEAAIVNSIPTAEGALQIAMEETNEVINEAKVIVLGYGRIGATVSHLFSAVGADVSVTARNSGYLARARQLGMNSLSFKELDQTIAKQHIVINTIPKRILDDKLLAKMDKNTLIIDLVSAPGGTDFVFAKEQGIKAIHALGLPGKVAPKTSGKQIANIILQWMENENGELE